MLEDRGKMRSKRRKEEQDTKMMMTSKWAINEENSIDPNSSIQLFDDNHEDEANEKQTQANRTNITVNTTTNSPKSLGNVFKTIIIILSSVSTIELVNSIGPANGLRFNPDTNSYSDLTFTFDPRLDRRVERLHFDHWLSIMQQSSELLHEALNGRAHLGEIRVLIPYKWRHLQWPVLHKPGAPIIMNRRLRYLDSDVIVGFDDPTYKETPFAVQHDECTRQGLHISMPISFLEHENQAISSDPRLKARMLVREFASHRYGLFKESGFRNDYMYPPFASLAGLSLTSKRTGWFNQTMLSGESNSNQNSTVGGTMDDESNGYYSLKGFDEHWNECYFDTKPTNGLPTTQSANCVPYLTKQASAAAAAAAEKSGSQSSSNSSPGQSFNLMSSDPFSHLDLSQTQQRSSSSSSIGRHSATHVPVEWRDLADSVKWHFCGDNFAATNSIQQQLSSSADPSSLSTELSSSGSLDTASKSSTSRQSMNDIRSGGRQLSSSGGSFSHNQLANNKQNVLCSERSAMEIIKASEDFRATQFSPSTFNRLPAPNFSFLQEMPPRVILCVEYAAHLFQSRRLDHGILEAAIGKFFAYDLIADSEIALVLFGQRNSSRNGFEKLDSSIKSRLTLYNPAFDPFDEPVKYYSEQELAQLFSGFDTASTATTTTGSQTSSGKSSSNQAKIVKGTCSFQKLMQEVSALQSQRGHSYDDIGADIVIISSGLFIEDEQKIEEIIRSQFKSDYHRLSLIIYPSIMLFDTKSHDNQFIVLDAIESDAIIRNRLAKLSLIQKLTNAQIHLVKEHLDSNGDVKMSTLIQFYQIFDHISKGHSWDQLQSMILLAHEQVETRHSNGSARLSFQFEVDGSIQNEFIVAFIDPKQHQLQQLKPGKRFLLRNLELRSPGGQLVLTDSHPWPLASVASDHHHHHHHHQGQSSVVGLTSPDTDQEEMLESRAGGLEQDVQHEQPQHPVASIESALFPFRTQLGLAGFHLKASHLLMLFNNSTGNNRISGVWTLSATSDEQIQTSAIAMARVNPAGDTLTSNCWIQTYNSDSFVSSDSVGPNAADQLIRMVKVFAQTKGPAGSGPVQGVQSRLEVQDEMGNIVQNINMLDDGLGSPDITQGDGIHSQYVQRAYRPGYYKVTVEVTGSGGSARSAHGALRAHQKISSASSSGNGQDTTCCGSFVPTSGQAESTKYLSRQLYCGTFYVSPTDRLGYQRPPRVNNLTVINVDQDNRRVTIRWFEPTTDITSPFPHPTSSRYQSSDSNDLIGSAEAISRFGRSATNLNNLRSPKRKTITRSSNQDDDDNDSELFEQQPNNLINQNAQVSRGLIVGTSRLAAQQMVDAPLTNRYEIKLFTDRDILKRSFDAKHHEVGYRFNEQNVEGSFPNASSYGGMKEVTLKIPNGREGIYFIAMKVYNNLGSGSQLSNIVQFWIQNNLTQDEVESLYGQSVTIDADGNVYDKNGELLGQRSTTGSSTTGLLRGATNTLDGLSILIFVSVCAFLFSIVCISLFACLISTARKSLATKHQDSDQGSKKKKKIKSKKLGNSGTGNIGSGAAILASGSGSSMVSSSQCEDSSHSEASIGGGSQGGHDVDINKLSLVAGEDLTFSQLRYQHQMQQQQADQIKNAYLQQSNHPYNNNSNDKSQPWLHHTIVNGYAYATVASPQQQQQHLQQQYNPENMNGGDLNQNGLLPSDPMSPVQSWPADILLSHYDKVKQARDRNEAPPVMRVETLEQQGQFGLDGLPQVDNEITNQQQQYEQSYLIRQQQRQIPSYFNQQLQQQLSSVLKSKQRFRQAHPNDDDDNLNSSPALEGVAQEGHEGGYDVGYNQVPPPPAQYIYQCTEANINLLNQVTGTDPSIYSQATGLQQVTGVSDSYYANSPQQWPPTTNSNIYGLAQDPYKQQQHGLPEGCFEESYDKPNSAISEV